MHPKGPFLGPDSGKVQNVTEAQKNCNKSIWMEIKYCHTEFKGNLTSSMDFAFSKLAGHGFSLSSLSTYK